MSYSVKQNGVLHNVIERGTNLIVAAKKDNDSARKLARSLNLGSGFNGFTPSFFCYKYEKSFEIISN